MDDTIVQTVDLQNQQYVEFLEKVNFITGIFRENPQIFCEMYLNIHLKDFQKVLLWEMVHNNYGMYIASRGQGKTYLSAIFAVVMCILYPGIKICVASATRSQGNELLLKITEDLMRNNEWGSENLQREIESFSIGINKAEIKFHNNSWIKVVTPSDTGRGNRANIILVDEFWMLHVSTINTVLRRFNGPPRQTGYLRLQQYKHLTERNKELYTGSAWMSSHWSFIKARSFFKNMLRDDKKYFLFSLPYQIAIKNGLLLREQLEDEMSEDDFDELKFTMEMESLFFGDTDGSFFNYDDILNVRKIEHPYYVQSEMPSGIHVEQIPDLLPNERRILSIDIALMASKKHQNDASSIMLNRALPSSKNKYIGNIVYIKNIEGIRSDDLTLEIRKLFSYFKCTDLVIDRVGLGLPICQDLMKDLIDVKTGEVYPALSCCNDKALAETCTVPDAPKVIWAVYGTDTFNSQICQALRAGIQNSRINFLVTKEESREIIIDSFKKYNNLTPIEKLAIEMPYIQTDYLVRELVGLQHEINGTKIKMKERSGARKDRYSSVAYNYWVQTQIEQEFLKKTRPTSTLEDYAKNLKKYSKKPIMY